MPIRLDEDTTFRKSIDLAVIPSAPGVAVSGHVRWFNDLYEIPSIAIACPYTDDARYGVYLCSSPPRLVLVEDDAAPSDTVGTHPLVRWTFTKATDTCASVTIDVTRRVLIPEPPTSHEEPITEMRPETVPCPNCDGTGWNWDYTPEHGEGDTKISCQICEGTGVAPVLDENGEPVMTEVIVGIRTFEIPPEPLPEPTVHQVSATPVLPIESPERAGSRKRRKRIRELTASAKAMKDAGMTYAKMSAAQRLEIGELVALTGEPAPLAVP